MLTEHFGVLILAFATSVVGCYTCSGADPQQISNRGSASDVITFRQTFSDKDEVTIPGRRVSYDLEHLSGERATKVMLSLSDDTTRGFISCYQWYYAYPGREIMPIFGSLYAVDNFEARGQRVTELTVRKVTDKRLVDECGVADGHLTILIDSELQFYQPDERSNHDRVRLKAIDRDQVSREKWIATVGTDRYRGSPRPNFVDYEYKKHELSVGDSFTMGSYKFTVAKIVPPDEKRRLIGWIELAHVKVESPKSK